MDSEDIHFQITALKEKALKHYQNQELEEALVFFQEALHLAEQLEENKALLVNHLSNLGSVQLSLKNYLESISYYSKALKLAKEIQHEEQIAIISLNLGITYQEQSIYAKALPYLLAAATFFEKNNQKAHLASALNTIANLYENIGEEEDALLYHNKALLINRALGKQGSIAISLNNIGMIYINQKKYEDALANFMEVLRINRITKQVKSQASSLANIGNVLYLQSRFTEAEKYFKDALKIRQKNKEQKGLAGTLHDLGKLYLNAKKYNKAKKYFKKSLKITQAIKAQLITIDNFQALINLYEKIGQPFKALDYFRQYDVLKHQVFKEDMMSKVNELKTKYETEKKEQEILLLNEKYEEVASLMKELHHRVKNSLQLLSGLLSLQSSKLADGEVKNAIKDGEFRVQAMMLIHQKLYKENNFSNVDTQQYLKDLIENIVYSYGQEIELHLNIIALNLNVDKAIPLGLIVNELVTNALKYAYKTQKKPQLSVSLNQRSTDNQELSLLVKDNGHGLPSDFQLETADSFGLKLIHTLTKQLKGNIKPSSSKKEGTTWSLQFASN